MCSWEKMADFLLCAFLHFQIQLDHEHDGLAFGADTALEGFVCEHPATNPPAVSSTAAS